MEAPLGGAQTPAFTVGDKNKCDYSRRTERLWVLAAALTYVRRGALVSAAVGAALGQDGILAVAVGVAEFSAHSHAPVIPRTHGCGEGRGYTVVNTFKRFDGKKEAENESRSY